MKRLLLLLALTFGGIANGNADTVTFRNGEESFELEFVTIDSPGNAADDPDELGLTWGAVGYVYQIGKYEVSTGARTVVSGDTPFLAPGQAVLPTSGTWERIADFVNWLNTSTGYHPAYKLIDLGEGHGSGAKRSELWDENDAGYDPNNRLRNSLARYVIPTGSEWHKAAYYDPETGEYFDYANGSNELPKGVDVPTLNQDEVIYGAGLPSVDVTMAGGLSPFGTMGQTGNGNEWEEEFYPTITLPLRHSFRAGGKFAPEDLRADTSRQPSQLGAGVRVVRLLPDSFVFGDFDDDGSLSSSDIDLLSMQLRIESNDLSFDLNSDGVLDSLDRTEWVEQLADTNFGDSDLNGEVAFNDFLAIANSFDQPAGWAGGDFDGNGMADFQDFLLLANNFGASNATEDVAAVPEPSSLAFCSGVVGLLLSRRRREAVSRPATLNLL